jgi:hypothetical protein
MAADSEKALVGSGAQRSGKDLERMKGSDEERFDSRHDERLVLISQQLQAVQKNLRDKQRVLLQVKAVLNSNTIVSIMCRVSTLQLNICSLK